MLRILLLAITMTSMFGFAPAFAQGGGAASCEDWCRANRCNGGMMNAGGGQQCMSQCVPICRQKMSKSK
jgi:hypothetical protein